ncbi:MAG TPA: aspartyl protease family protein [Gemmataceae bacterium]|nr:aspartyl protease family protein [Gemmataceae bacterium]
MSLFFRYNIVAASRAVVTLGGRWSRPRPLLPLAVIGPANTAAVDGCLDTGADDTVFSEHIAARIGLDLTNALQGQLTTATLANAPVRYAQVVLRVTDGKEQREWSAWVGFTPAKLQTPLLGFAGFLQFFTAVFRGDREEIELTVNSLYPGT